MCELLVLAWEIYATVLKQEPILDPDLWWTVKVVALNNQEREDT